MNILSLNYSFFYFVCIYFQCTGTEWLRQYQESSLAVKLLEDAEAEEHSLLSNSENISHQRERTARSNKSGENDDKYSNVGDGINSKDKSVSAVSTVVRTDELHVDGMRRESSQDSSSLTQYPVSDTVSVYESVSESVAIKVEKGANEVSVEIIELRQGDRMTEDGVGTAMTVEKTVGIIVEKGIDGVNDGIRVETV